MAGPSKSDLKPYKSPETRGSTDEVGRPCVDPKLISHRRLYYFMLEVSSLDVFVSSLVTDLSQECFVSTNVLLRKHLVRTDEKALGYDEFFCVP